MPRVPTAKRRVRESILPNARVNTQSSAENFGGGQGVEEITRSSESLLNTGMQIYKEEKDKADNSVTLNTKSKFLNDYNKLWNDPESGFASLKGKETAVKQKEYINKFDEIANKHMQSLSNDEQRAKFKEIVRGYKEDFNKRSQGHIFNEVTTYNNQESESNLKYNQEFAVQNYTVPGKVGESLENQYQIIDEFGERNGLPKSEIEMRKLQASSNTHYNVLNQMVNDGDYKKAQAYVKMTQDKVDSDTALKMEDLVSRGTLKGESMEITDSIVSQGLSKREALQEARKIEDPNKRDSVVSRLKTRYAELDNFKKEDQFNTYNEVGKTILNGGSLDDLPEEKVMKLSYKQLKEFQKYERDMKSGKTVETDLKVYHELERLASEKPNAFKQLPLTQYLTKLGESDFKKFSKMQAGLRGGSEDAMNDLKDIRSRKDVVNQHLREMGVEYGSKASEEDLKKANKFRDRVLNVVSEKQAELGRRLNSIEMNDVVEDLRTELVIDRGIFSSGNVLSYEIGPENLDDIEWDDLDDTEREKVVFSLQRNIKYDDLPQEEVGKITDAIIRSGQQPSKDKIVQIYLKGISRKATPNG